MSDPSRKEAEVLSLPAWEQACEAVLEGDRLALGARFCPVEKAAGDDRARYELAPGTVVAVASARSLAPQRAYAVEADGTVTEISAAAAEDRIDPAGAARRAWRRRCSRVGLTEAPCRFPVPAGHGYEADVVYDWAGEEHVAACTRATDRRVWLRAVTYEEAVELGLA
ncbi:hypothetical protein NS228_05285 [Methylobacterium indicum]|nr:hypothetical protein [Methylobacterium indicum]KTS34222.1 hypothetical protein NS229_11440 [Methylobacterium indicum]KTS41794.1 hypothetical protein NS228_05285 [Methylobacterium indicum]KTS53110.1 hypothetical protein NS230_07690 [Methylobacterium indicum]